MAETITVECSVDFDDELEQVDCHWNYKRFFNITCKVTGTHYSTQLYYRFGNRSENVINNVSAKTVGNVTIYSYRLDFSNLDLEALASAGKITVYAKVNNNDTYTGTCSYDYYLEMPPKTYDKSEAADVKLTRISADHIICSWPAATAFSEDEDGASVAGYAVELLCCKVGTDEFKHLHIDKELVDGKYRLIKVNTEEKIFSDPTEEVLNNDFILESNLTAVEAYLDNLNNTDVTEVYFNPRELGIEKDDDFQMIVYPYTVYGSYLEGQEVKHSALLTNAGTSTAEMKFKLGVVRVKTEGGWVEGQVWVMAKDNNGNNKWVEADGVFVNTANGWQESI